MELQVSTKNEYLFYPDIANNLELKEQERFTIVVKRVNPAIDGIGWYKDNYETMDNKARLKSYIKEIKNAPILKLDTGESKEMSVDDLLGDSYQELFDIVSQLNVFVNDLTVESDDVKK